VDELALVDSQIFEFAHFGNQEGQDAGVEEGDAVEVDVFDVFGEVVDRETWEPVRYIIMLG
jgi:hypothetical protein